MRIKVTYKTTEPRLELQVDEKIRSAMKSVGFELTGSGFDLKTNERDISFEYTPEPSC